MRGDHSVTVYYTWWADLVPEVQVNKWGSTQEFRVGVGMGCFWLSVCVVVNGGWRAGEFMQGIEVVSTAQIPRGHFFHRKAATTYWVLGKQGFNHLLRLWGSLSQVSSLYVPMCSYPHIAQKAFFISGISDYKGQQNLWGFVGGSICAALHLLAMWPWAKFHTNPYHQIPETASAQSALSFCRRQGTGLSPMPMSMNA